MSLSIRCTSPICLLITVFGALPAQQDTRPTFTVGSAIARRGETVTGVITVPAGVDSGYAIPVAVIHGARPGPVLALVSGQHGTEYSTIVGMQRLIPMIDAKKISGTVIVVPVVNVPSFVQMYPARNPTDNKSMLGVWPGDSAGTQSSRAVLQLMREVVNQADVIVDFHGGDVDEDIGVPFTAVVRGGKAKPDSESVRLAMAFAIPHIQIIDHDPAAPGTGRRIDGQALIKGLPVILVGVGRSGVVTDAEIRMITTGCLNMMAALKMIARPEPRRIKPIWLDANAPRIGAQGPGAFFATVPHAAMVKKGQQLGYTTDLLGKKTGDVVSPIDGLVVYVHGLPSMRRGVTLAEVLPVLQQVPAWKGRSGN